MKDMKMAQEAKEALKKALDDLKKLTRAADEADNAYQADPENIEKEAAFDAAYDAEYNKTEEIAELIVKITEGKIDSKTALMMASWKHWEIRGLLFEEWVSYQ